MLPHDVLIALKEEMVAQVNAIRDLGINVSHIDSHQHIHVTLGFLPIMPGVLKETSVHKMRGIFNYIPMGINKLTRSMWRNYMFHRTPNLSMTDIFTNYAGFINNFPKIGCKDNYTIELMCHPSINTGMYRNENLLIENSNPILKLPNVELINYNDL